MRPLAQPDPFPNPRLPHKIAHRRTLSHTGPEDMCTLARNPRAGDVYAFGCMLLELQGPHIKSGWTQTCFEMGALRFRNERGSHVLVCHVWVPVALPGSP